MASVEITNQAQKEFDDLPTVIKVRMKNIFEKLQKWPDVSGVKALTGNFAGYSRVKTGDYRAVFSIHPDRIIICRVGHRSKVYKKPI